MSMTTTKATTQRTTKPSNPFARGAIAAGKRVEFWKADNKQWLDQPLRWKKPRKIFVCAHGDLFHPAVPDEWIDKVFAVMALAPQHTFQVLTKRPDRARYYLTSGREFSIGQVAYAMATTDAQRGQLEAFGAEDDPNIITKVWPLPKVWLGTSISDQQSWDIRWPELARCPAAIRFISAEPLLGHVDMIGSGKLDWLICGGESGPNARPMHPDLARSLRDQCAAAGVPFLFKQWGEFAPTDRPREWFHHTPDREAGCMISKWPTNDSDTMEIMLRIGKTRAGRLLDGIEHNGFPGVMA